MKCVVSDETFAALKYLEGQMMLANGYELSVEVGRIRGTVWSMPFIDDIVGPSKLLMPWLGDGKR